MEIPTETATVDELRLQCLSGTHSQILFRSGKYGVKYCK